MSVKLLVSNLVDNLYGENFFNEAMGGFNPHQPPLATPLTLTRPSDCFYSLGLRLAIFDVDLLGIVIFHSILFLLYRCAFCHALFTIT